MVLGYANPDMRGALLVAECAAHRRGTETLPARAFVHETLADKEPVDIERRASIFSLALGVGDGAAQHFFNVLRGALRRVAERVQRVLRALPTNQIDNQAGLLRRHAHMARHSVSFNQCQICLNVNHGLCLRRWCWCRAASWSRCRRLLECRLDGVALEGARRRKFSEFVAD